MHLCLDIGNSNTKISLWNGSSFSRVLIPELTNLSDLPCIVSQSGNPTELEATFEHFKNRPIRVKEYFIENNFLDMPVDYSSTLGEDRLVQSYYCFHHFPKPTLLIDAGTFTTFNFINSDGMKGGFIFPSPEVLLNSYNRGHQLFSAQLEESIAVKPATNSASAMSQAVALSYSGLIKEIMAMEHFKTIVVTGGNLSIVNKILSPHLKNEQQLIICEDLIHQSLNFFFHSIKKEKSQ